MLLTIFNENMRQRYTILFKYPTIHNPFLRLKVVKYKAFTSSPLSIILTLFVNHVVIKASVPFQKYCVQQSCSEDYTPCDMLQNDWWHTSL